MSFTNRLSQLLSEEYQLQPENFLQYKTAAQMHDTFIRSAREFFPFIGLARRPGAPIPQLPNEQQMKEIGEGKKKFDLNESSPDYCYWFLKKTSRRQREVFQGCGGLTQLFRKSDPKTSPPIPSHFRKHGAAFFEKFDLDGLLGAGASLTDEFQAKSKLVCGKGLERNVQFEFISFVLPWLNSQDFFDLSDEDLQKHFDLFSVYINESILDSGIVLASSVDFEEPMIAILDEMRRSGEDYPGID